MSATTAIQAELRALAPQVTAALARRCKDFAAAEDAVQEALLAAALQWPEQGHPEEPRAWLFRVASRRLTDQLRAESARRRREAAWVAQREDEADDTLYHHDDTLELLFLCCHPALSTSAAIALTLRAVGGLTTQEIAGAFLVPEATMGQRISRAKQRIKASEMPFAPLTAEATAQRLVAVMHILYLIFNEGYSATSGAAVARTDLSHEAIRLTRMLRALAPHSAEVVGLLALMLLTDARRLARSGPAGQLIPLDEQDRGCWDQDAIAEGTALLTEALGRGMVGPYQIQAAIAALHDEAASAELTDWAQICALYKLLLRMQDNPMIALNHAIAESMVLGPQLGLERLDALAADPRLANSHRLDAARAHLHERAGQRERALACYQRASARTTSQAERDYLILRAARLAERGLH
jgi:RNA polymerase sigma factor (sigma-70 family)